MFTSIWIDIEMQVDVVVIIVVVVVFDVDDDYVYVVWLKSITSLGDDYIESLYKYMDCIICFFFES